MGGGHTFLKHDRNATGFKMDSFEIAGGTQMALDSCWTVGVAGEYAHDHINYNVGGSARSTSGLVGLYALFRPKAYYLLANVILDYNTSKVKRHIVVGDIRRTAHGNPKSFQETFYVEGGFDWNCHCFLVQPFLGVEADIFHTNKFCEHGASPLNLRVYKKCHTNAYSRLGVHLSAAKLCWTMNVDLAWQCRLTSFRNTLDVKFLDFGAKFPILGVHVPRTASLIEAAVTTRTRAVLPVSLYGQVADMDEINAIAARHGLAVIEDAAQSFGANYKGRRSCNLSTFGCTSFFPSKPLGCYGDGGAVFTSDDALAQACREIRVHGQSARYTHTRVGVGGRMDTLQCAIVLAKLERFAWELERRQAIGARYAALLDAAGIERVVTRADRDDVLAQLTVFVDDRARVQAALADAGIPTAVHYPKPLHHQPAYAAGHDPASHPHSLRAAARVLSLPMSADLTEAQQDRVVAALRGAVRAA